MNPTIQLFIEKRKGLKPILHYTKHLKHWGQTIPIAINIENLKTYNYQIDLVCTEPEEGYEIGDVVEELKPENLDFGFAPDMDESEFWYQKPITIKSKPTTDIIEGHEFQITPKKWDLKLTLFPTTEK